jgi:DNA-binding MarR family transcriptional regulator
MKSLGIDYTIEPYKWIVTITPRGVMVAHDRDYSDASLGGNDIRVLQHLAVETDEGSLELSVLNRELNSNPSATKDVIKRLQSKGLVTIKFIHDMKSKFGVY